MMKNIRPSIRLRSRSYRVSVLSVYLFYLYRSLDIKQGQNAIALLAGSEHSLSLTTGSLRYSFVRGRERKQNISHTAHFIPRIPQIVPD